MVCEPSLRGSSNLALASISSLTLSLIIASSSRVGSVTAIIHAMEKDAGMVRSLLASPVSIMRMSLGHGIALCANSNASLYTSQ
eukprot:11865709-Alexandrium_andersonii.AAC.1